MADRPYLSIGEVLSLLKDEFPDVTISKIRFLESQGLLDPERTPSGYRKFYEEDVDRLRYILRQQKEHFLPLRVIKDRLATNGEVFETSDDTGDGPAELVGAPTLLDAADPPAEASGHEPSRPDGEPAGGRAATNGSPAPVPPTAPPEPAATRPAPAAPAAAITAEDAGRFLSAGSTGASLTFEELGEASGVEPAVLKDLEKYGLIAGRSAGGSVYYDEEALLVARVAADFRRFGVEARHLRFYKTAAEREAGLFEQIVTPLLKQRNPHARAEAVRNVGELSGLGEQLRTSMLRLALRGLTGA